MIVWRGWGALVLIQFMFWLMVVAFLPSVVLTIGPNQSEMDVLNRWMSGRQVADLWIAGACLMSALTCLAMSRWRRTHPNRVIDQATGEATQIPRLDDLWYIELSYWPWIFLAPGLIGLGLAALNIGPG